MNVAYYFKPLNAKRMLIGDHYFDEGRNSHYFKWEMSIGTLASLYHIMGGHIEKDGS